MRKIFICFSLCFLFLSNSVNAYECSKDDKLRLAKFANNVNYSLEEYDDGNGPRFKAIFTGISKEIKLYNGRKSTFMKNNQNYYVGESFIVDLEPGYTYDFIVQGNNKCLFEKIKIIHVKIPNYNLYYNDAACKQAEDYALCQKWVKNENNYETFIDKINKYIEDIKENNDSNVNNDTGNRFDFYDFYNKYYFLVLIGTVCLFILLVIFWIKENKKNQL